MAREEVPEVKFEEENPSAGSPFTTFDDNSQIIVEGIDPDPEVGPPKDEGPSRDELMREVENLRTQQEELNQRADSNLALRQGLSELKESLARPQTLREPVRQQPGESDAQFAERLKEGLLDDPENLLNERDRRKFSPIFDKILGNNLSLQRKLTKLERGESFDRYANEIDREVQLMDRTDPDVYGKAHDIVVSRHLGDEKDRMKQEILEELKKEQPVSQPSTPPFSPNNGPSPPPVNNRGRYIRITPEQKAQAEKDAIRKGIDVNKLIQVRYGGRVK